MAARTEGNMGATEGNTAATREGNMGTTEGNMAATREGNMGATEGNLSRWSRRLGQWQYPILHCS